MKVAINVESISDLDPDRPRQAPTSSPYIYNARVVSVYDSDTCTLKIDLGFRVEHVIQVRLSGIDTPEMNGPNKQAGLAARDYLKELLVDKKFLVKTYKDKKEKYGRYLAEIFVDGKDVATMLREAGYAVDYLGGKRTNLPV